MTQSVLRASNLRKSYRGRVVVEDLSLQVESGEVVGLLGPNGAGKSTSFYMIVGLVSADSGSIMLNDTDLTGLAMHKRARLGLGYLPQEASVFRRLSVGTQHPRHPRDPRRPGLGRAPRGDGKDHRGPAHRPCAQEPRHFPLGRRTAARGRSRAHWRRAPHFILLDEPFAGVDPISVLDIQRIVGGLAARGIGVLITDHNVRETLGGFATGPASWTAEP